MADLECPICEHREWISPEDPDATISAMFRHVRGAHPEDEPQVLMRGVREVPSRG